MRCVAERSSREFVSELLHAAALVWTPLSLLGDIYSTLERKMPPTSTGETNALFWLPRVKSWSPSKWILRLFKLSMIAQLSAAQRSLNWCTQSFLHLDCDWSFLARGDCFYTFISAHLLLKPSLNKLLGPWHSLYSTERETIFFIVTASNHTTI